MPTRRRLNHTVEKREIAWLRRKGARENPVVDEDTLQQGSDALSALLQLSYHRARTIRTIFNLFF